jgi:hypothetical protein
MGVMRYGPPFLGAAPLPALPPERPEIYAKAQDCAHFQPEGQ